MNLKDFTTPRFMKNTSKVKKIFGDDITPADLKRVGASQPQIYMHKDGKTIMVPKAKEQEYAKQGYKKSSLRAETKVNERMPASIIKHKVKLGQMSDAELADRFKDYDEQRLRQMAWRHGYGKMSPYYWDRVQAGRKELDHREISDIMKYESVDVPKDHEYGPSSEERPAGKRGYTSSGRARTTHLKTVKQQANKKRRQMDKDINKYENIKNFINEVNEDYARMTKDLIIKLVKKGKTDDEIQQATGETGKRIEIIRKNTKKEIKNNAMDEAISEKCKALGIDETKDEFKVARLIGETESAIAYGIEFADAVLKGDKIAEVKAETVKSLWPTLLNKIQNIYKDNVKESQPIEPTPSQMSDEDLAILIGSDPKKPAWDEAVEWVKNNREEAEEIANDKNKDYAYDNMESKTNEDNGRRDFMRKAAATAGAVALGTIAPSKAWPDEPPENFDFMDEFFSDKILNDPKYKDFKLKGKDFLDMIKNLEKKWDKDKNKDDGSIEI